MKVYVATAALSGFVFAAVLAWPASGPVATGNAASTGEGFVCRVTGVHDGDGPIYCQGGPKIRLTAVAARELDGSCSPGRPCPDASAAAATAELDRLTRGQTLRCEQTGTSYDRVTAWCWRQDGVELNCAMVRSGKAAYWRRYDPNGRLCGNQR